MKMPRIVSGLAAIAFFVLSPLTGAAIQLDPVVSTGLSSPVFVTHAGDGSNRLFIVEQGGFIRVLQPGSSTPTLFLDIHTKVLSGGERGLLGLAFHPQYSSNGRFFVYYTRTGDGALVIAEYHVSGNANVADSTEAVLLTILHPTNSNHNGGMLAFGPDGLLYIGVGDGGSGNDPPNNAQNINVLLGKILRIDVTPTGAYVSPSTNPFFGSTAGLDEIFAFGFRNPWRFSFDRLTGNQWVADVGQGAREEVDTPIVVGGNYGWRVYEGFSCTGNDPSLCTPANYRFPIFDYPHVNGRCSITGGYVYRGTQGALPAGTYVFGDYCTGEIFAWDGTSQTLLLDTTMNISSFGEDGVGELYVVNLGGTVSKIVSSLSCTYSIAPTSQSFGSAGGSGTTAVTAGAGCGWSATANVSWLHITAGASGSGNGNVGYSVDANTSTSSRSGTLTVAGQTFTVNQAGAPCTYSIAPTSQSFGSAGGSGTTAVTAGAGCGWSATANVSWLHITAGASGSGNGNVGYSVDANTSTSSRSGTLTVAGQTFTVNQAGAPCTYSIAPTSQSFGSAGGSGTTAVTAGAGCGWSATANVSWLHITAGASGSGNGNVGYSVDANTSTSSRSGTLTVAGQTFTVNQAGAPACTSTISPTSANFTRVGGTGSVSVSVASGCTWTAVSNSSWITVTGGANGSGNETVSYSVGPYGGPPKNRTGTMTIAGKTFTVKQTK